MRKERSPGIKLLFTVLIGIALIVPLMMVYALNSDRQHQQRTAQQSISQGWAGSQTVSGPVIMIPYLSERVVNETVDGKTTRRTIEDRLEMFLSPEEQIIGTNIEPTRKGKSIYETVLYLAKMDGEARFALPDDLARYGVRPDQLLLDEAELRFGASDARGLQSDARAAVNGDAVELQPGKGVAASNNSGFYGYIDLSEAGPVNLTWSYSLRGSQSLGVVPRGGSTTWTARSVWPHPNFGGSFLPEETTISDDGFTASWSVANLALGQEIVQFSDAPPPMMDDNGNSYPREVNAEGSPASAVATIGLVDPVDVYSQLDRAIKYGLLFIGFTFLAFLMFDIVGGARVAAPEYLLTGVGLILFFVLLLAFAEVVGFAIAYIIASAAIIGLITAYSAAVLSSWRRARMIGGMLIGLYALLYVLLSLEAWSLVIGSVLLFAALAAVMYATRGIDWSSVGRPEGGDGDYIAQ